MSYFDAALELHKARFEEWRALVVLDDKPLRRYVLCWRPHLVRRLNDWPLDSDLMALWDCVKVDHQALVDLTGSTLPEMMGRFRQAQGMELIYPDGAVAAAVVKVLMAKVSEIKGL